MRGRHPDIISKRAKVSGVWWSCLLCVGLALVGCAEEQDALLLTITAERPVSFYSLVVVDPQSREKLLWLVDEPVDTSDASRDISQPDQALKIAVTFDRPQTVVVHVVGRTGAADVVSTRVFAVEGVTHERLHLISLNAADRDGDGFADSAVCDTLPEDTVDCAWSDCDDFDPDVNPLAEDRCGNGLDEDCSGEDALCEDADGDGSPAGLDCDDSDPNRFPGNPERPNGCPTAQYPEGLADPGCDDGLDQDCDEQDVICVPDADCDGAPAAVDCDDNDPERYPGAAERCDNQIDDNCDGAVDEHCVDCDLDGDGFQRVDALHGCPTADYPAGQDTDCDDRDAGVYPGVTAACAGNEGGAPACAAMALCDGRDNDCDGDVDEGCPPAVSGCDEDGDGFQPQAGGCSPLPGQADCDDSDPTVYPGAPDYCGDGVLQNCNTDTACLTDGDGDHYNAAEDCDDTDPTIHPWAVERCNGVDDDCDGLVDEGNPDGAGTPLGDLYCNDIGLGVCGDPAGAGRCVCSAANPDSTRDPASRTACPDEDLLAASSPRCFFAPTPAMEQCDETDHDCDGQLDDPDGSNLLELGQPCGSDAGACVAGAVVGCDLSQPIEGTLVAGFLCDATFVGPQPDLCNGINETCVNGLTDDGIDECTAATPDCCGDLSLCVDLQTDMDHCGQCDHACDPVRADHCEGGSCRCGDGARCNSNKTCKLSGGVMKCK